MPFRIRPDADFTEEFRKAAAGEMRKAISALEEQPNGAHEAIHDFRKNLKRVRSLYRLVAKEEPDFQKRENTRLREVAKSLSAIRDAAALIDTAIYLKTNARTREEGDAIGRIVTILEARRDWTGEAESGVEPKLLSAANTLKEAIASVNEVSFSRGRRKNAGMLAKGWRKTSGKARTAIDVCHGEASADSFHELRKRAQDYRAYHALLRAVWPGAMKAKREAANSLVDILGHVHDLVVLCELVEAEPQLFTRNDDLTHLLDAIIYRQQEDRREALIKAEDVFADHPDEEAQRIELLWLAVGS